MPTQKVRKKSAGKRCFGVVSPGIANFRPPNENPPGRGREGKKFQKGGAKKLPIGGGG